jgi:hypothetical protein
MTEVDWLACADPKPMLAFLKRKASTRKFRLFAAELWRRRAGKLRTLADLRKAVEAAEAMADGLRKRKRGDDKWIVLGVHASLVATRTSEIVAGLSGKGHVGAAAQADLLRELFNPFGPRAAKSEWLKGNDWAALELAQVIYEERAFDRLPILGDALEDAGCAEERVLEHCRAPGPHQRGCWVVDLVLGKA